jgi:hypothetical protein
LTSRLIQKIVQVQFILFIYVLMLYVF